MPKVIVYVKSADAASLKAEGKDPAEWVRALVKRAFERRADERV